MDTNAKAVCTWGVAVLLAQGALSLGWAADTDPMGAVKACTAERSDARRLACFDAAAAQFATAPDSATAGSAAPAAPGAPVVAATPSLTKEEKFGLRGDLKEEKVEQAPELAELQELQAVVTRVAAKPHGELIVTLDNGQVWHEIQPGSGIRVKVGDTVTIRAGALGSYSVVAPNRRSSKVTRVR